MIWVVFHIRGKDREQDQFPGCGIRLFITKKPVIQFDIGFQPYGIVGSKNDRLLQTIVIKLLTICVMYK